MFYIVRISPVFFLFLMSSSLVNDQVKAKHEKSLAHGKNIGIGTTNCIERYKVIQTPMPGDANSIAGLQPQGGTPQRTKIAITWFGFFKDTCGWKYRKDFPCNINCSYDTTELLQVNPGSICKGFVFRITARDARRNAVEITYPTLRRRRQVGQPIEMTLPISPPVVTASFISLVLEPPFDHCSLLIEFFAVTNTSQDRVLVANFSSPAISLVRKEPNFEFSYDGQQITFQGHRYEKDIAHFISVSERGGWSHWSLAWWKAQCIFRGLEADDIKANLARRLKGHEGDPIKAEFLELQETFILQAASQRQQGLDSSRRTAKRSRLNVNGNCPFPLQLLL
jgi:hypothetical protein